MKKYSAPTFECQTVYPDTTIASNQTCLACGTPGFVSAGTTCASDYNIGANANPANYVMINGSWYECVSYGDHYCK